MSCKRCGSWAINHGHHGRDGSEPTLCDVCYWRQRTEQCTASNATKDAEIARLREALSVIAYPLNIGKVYHMDAVTQARAALAQVAEVGMASEWLPIESAPKDGSELIGWRDDAGVLLIRWTCCADFMSDREIEDATKGHGGDSEWIEQYNWFYADFISGGRLEGDEEPTHWMPLPEPPK